MRIMGIFYTVLFLAKSETKIEKLYAFSLNGKRRQSGIEGCGCRSANCPNNELGVSWLVRTRN